MQRLSSGVLGLAGSMAMVVAPTALHADTSFPAIGGGGDAQVEDRCPAGMWLVGLKGRGGVWIDQVQIVCARIAPGGTQGPLWYGPARGGNGGGAQEFVCDPESAVYAAQPFPTIDGRMTKYVDVKCGSMREDRQSGFRFNSEATRTGRTSMQGPQLQVCPRGELAAGFAIHYGKDVNAMGLLCRRR